MYSEWRLLIYPAVQFKDDDINEDEDGDKDEEKVHQKDNTKYLCHKTYDT